MKTEQIIILVVAFFLGMLLLNMFKYVCGCDVVEGWREFGGDFGQSGWGGAVISSEDQPELRKCGKVISSLTGKSYIRTDPSEMF